MENPYIVQTLEVELRSAFVKYGPVLTMKVWDKVLSDFRQALGECDTKPQTIVLKDVVEPVTKNPLEIHRPAAKAALPEKEAQKEKLRLHKEAIASKRTELAQKGVIPETQLTEENLKQWIQKENKNYWTIAELTGCNDTDVSSRAKSLNILSETAAYIRRKKRSQI